MTTIAATPTVVWKSAAICGSSESVTRTCAWLAKPAAASRMMERVGVWRGEGWAGESALTRLNLLGGAAVGAAGVDTPRDAGFLARAIAEAKDDDREDISARARSRAAFMQPGRRRAPSAPAGPSAPRPSLIASSFRRRTSPARCIWAMRSTTPCRTFSAASSACAARTCCGSRAPITPASPRRWWSSAN